MATRLSFRPARDGIVGEVHRMDFQRRVAIHEAVELVGAESEGSNHLARQVVLAPVCDGAALDQRQDAVADHLGVDAEVVLVRELHHHGVGDAAVADLQRRAVVDQVGDIFADGLLHRADLRQPDFDHRLAAFDQRRDLRDVHMAVAEGEGHVGVDLEHHRARLGDGGHGVVGAQAEGEIAVRRPSATPC